MSEITPEWPSPPAIPIPAPVYTQATSGVAWERPVPAPRAYTEQRDVEALIDAQFAWAQLTPCQQCGRIVAHAQAAQCEPCMVDNSPRMHGYAPEKHTAEYDALSRRFLAMTGHRDDLAAEVTRIRGQLAERTAQVVYTGKVEPLPYPLEDEPPCTTCAELDGWLTLARQENRQLRGQLADAQAAAVRASKMQTPAT